MPDTVETPAQDEQPKAQSDATAETDARQQVHAADFPEAPQDAPAGCSNQLDILLDMEVPVTVVLGTTQIPVRRLLQLGPGAVLKLDKSIAAPVDLFLKDAKFAEAEVVVVEDRFAVRIKQIIGTATPANPAQAQGAFMSTGSVNA